MSCMLGAGGTGVAVDASLLPFLLDFDLGSWADVAVDNALAVGLSAGLGETAADRAVAVEAVVDAAGSAAESDGTKCRRSAWLGPACGCASRST